MKTNETANLKSFFNTAMILPNSKNPSESDRSSHKSKLFGSPPVKFSNTSHISDILNQITTSKANGHKPIYAISDRKSSGYINLASQRKVFLGGNNLSDTKQTIGKFIKKKDINVVKNDGDFMGEIDKCLKYFEKTNGNSATVETQGDSYDTLKNMRYGKSGGKLEKKHRVNSFHEFGKETNGRENIKIDKQLEFLMKDMNRKEKILMNEINCYKAKENQYITRISYYDSKVNKLKGLLFQRKQKAKELKCKFIKEQILKENAIGLIKNILENANDKDYVETMKRLLKNENGTLLFQMANHAKIGLETKGSLEKKSTNDEEIDLDLSSEIDDIIETKRAFDLEKPLITTMIEDKRSIDNSPNLHCQEMIDYKGSQLTLLDGNFF